MGHLVQGENITRKLGTTTHQCIIIAQDRVIMIRSVLIFLDATKKRTTFKNIPRLGQQSKMVVSRVAITTMNFSDTKKEDLMSVIITIIM